MQVFLAFIGISMGTLVLLLFGGTLHFSMRNGEIFKELRDFAGKRGISMDWEGLFRSTIQWQSERRGKVALIQKILSGSNIFELAQFPDLKETDDQTFVKEKFDALSRNYAKSITLFFGSALALFVLSFLALMGIVLTV